ncbi:MAG: response regulator transcription factor [Anaerolineales bacterium]|nr:response regulator transcription factor [Anaerolineales bacterium]NUQ83698.1 response regulator transcription factor [Anaerolineales bacterium]
MTPTRVLIVDDVEQVRRDLSTALSLSGELEIVGEAANGSEAIRMIESLKPDVVLMDLEMPVMDGYEATRKIKSLYPLRRVIALTVHDYESARMKAEQSGVDGFLVKGASVESIVQAITENVPQVDQTQAIPREKPAGQQQIQKE